MKTTQYTIRNVPEPVNRYLRKRAAQSGKSLNQVILDKLSENVASMSETADVAFDWFIGSGIDAATLHALEEDDKTQKALAAKDFSTKGKK